MLILQGVDFINLGGNKNLFFEKKPAITTWVALLAGGGVYDDKVLNKDKTFFV